MNKLTVITTEEAQEDLKGIVAYIATDNKQAASNFAKIIRKTFVYLSEFPRMGKKRIEYTDEDVLFFTIKWGYNIVYSIQDDKLYILRILTESQDYRTLF